MMFSADACKMAMVDVCEFLAFIFHYSPRSDWENMPNQDLACSFIDYNSTDWAPQFPPLDDD